MQALGTDAASAPRSGGGHRSSRRRVAVNWRTNGARGAMRQRGSAGSLAPTADRASVRPERQTVRRRPAPASGPTLLAGDGRNQKRAAPYVKAALYWAARRSCSPGSGWPASVLLRQRPWDTSGARDQGDSEGWGGGGGFGGRERAQRPRRVVGPYVFLVGPGVRRPWRQRRSAPSVELRSSTRRMLSSLSGRRREVRSRPRADGARASRTGRPAQRAAGAGRASRGLEA